MPAAPAAPRAEAGGFSEDFFLSLYKCEHTWRLEEGILRLELQESHSTLELGAEKQVLSSAERSLHLGQIFEPRGSEASLDNMMRPWHGWAPGGRTKKSGSSGHKCYSQSDCGVTVGALTGHLSGARSALRVLSLITPFFREMLNPKGFSER